MPANIALDDSSVRSLRVLDCLAQLYHAVVLAYKFRGSDQLHFALDIIYEQRLFCSVRKGLNDPDEGGFGAMVFGDGNDESDREAVLEYQHKLRLCALCRQFDSIPLWGYYASGFAGMVLEVQIPEPQQYDPGLEEGEVKIRDVRYDDNRSLGALPRDNPVAAAYESLAMKSPAWEHEAEVRVIASVDSLRYGQYYQLESKVRRVILGGRNTHATVGAMSDVCAAQGIGLELAFVEQRAVSLHRVLPPDDER